MNRTKGIESNRFLDVLVTFTATKGDQTVRGDVLITVINEELSDSHGTVFDALGGENTQVVPTQAVPGTPKKETQIIDGGATAPGAPAAIPIISNPNGKPDLSVRVLAVGTIDKETDQFIATSTVERAGKAAIRFEVTNIGTRSSGLWSFSSTLPTISTYVFRPSEQQNSLNPGDRIEYTLSFDLIKKADEGTITVDVDPGLKLDEITRDNNHAEATFSIINN